MHTVSVAALNYVNRELQSFRDLKLSWTLDSLVSLSLVSQRHVQQCIFVIPVSSLQWIESGEDGLAHEMDVLTSKQVFLLTVIPKVMILEVCLFVIWVCWLS